MTPQSDFLSMAYYDTSRQAQRSRWGRTCPRVIHYYQLAHPYYIPSVVIGAKTPLRLDSGYYGWPAPCTWCIAPWDHANVNFGSSPISRDYSTQKRRDPGLFQFDIGGDPEDVGCGLTPPEGRGHAEKRFVFAMTGYRPEKQFIPTLTAPFRIRLLGRPYTAPETPKLSQGIYLAGVLLAGMHTNEDFY